MEQNKKKKRFFVLRIGAVILFALCIFGLLFANNVRRAVEDAVYPRRYSSTVQAYARKYDLDPNLIYAVIRTESGFDPNAESKAYARGLMQITEETFQWIKSKIALEEAVVFDDLYTPEVNIRFGTYLLSVCLRRYQGDISTAAAAYHSGMGKVDSLLDNEAYSQDGITLHAFPYTQMNLYVQKINQNYQKYCAIALEEGK